MMCQGSTKIPKLLQNADDSQQIQRLVYRSRSAIEPTEARRQIEDILRVAQSKNQLFGVTGAMVLHEDRFAQMIEGPPGSLRNLFASISQDPRHDGIEASDFEDTPIRVFSRWSMALIGEDSRADIPLFATASSLVQGSRYGLSSTEVLLVDRLRQLVM